jgi:hypothetical protein
MREEERRVVVAKGNKGERLVSDVHLDPADVFCLVIFFFLLWVLFSHRRSSVPLVPGAKAKKAKKPKNDQKAGNRSNTKLGMVSFRAELCFPLQVK